MRWVPAIAVIIVAAVISGCGGGGSSAPPSPPPPPPPPPGVAVATRFVIDGIADFTVFDQTTTRTVELLDNLGSGMPVATINVEWGVLNDDRDMYLAVRWDDATLNNTFEFVQGPLDFDGLRLLLDSDLSGNVDDSDDSRALIAAGPTSFYIDQHRLGGSDVDDDIGDGQARLRYDTATASYTAEFLIPRTADSRGEDAVVDSTTPFNLVFTDNFVISSLTGNVGTLFASQQSTVAWGTLDITSGGLFVHPEKPAGLTRMIAFISEHDVPGNGEIYTFEPTTGVVTRVTILPNLFKDNISLSHDRNRIAFHGAPAKDAFAQFEIYTVNIDGSGFSRLTNNTILDGHPAWSPDDSRIAYVSFRDPAGESIVVMTADGTEIADLGSPGFADNDPDYTPDGRLVFKTNRFSASPNLRIAVMNEDGSNVLKVTRITGRSDHDPVADATSTVFERFTLDTDFSTDPDFAFVGWNIVQAALDGSGETTLLEDGWINWLPVYDPSAQYIAYQKTVGAFTELRLMSRAGEEFGRLVPDITGIRYTDWK